MKVNLIFPGELRGVASFGMMCSPRELQLPNAPQKRGIIELASSEVVEEEESVIPEEFHFLSDKITLQDD